MYEEGYFSVWLGDANSEQVLEEYVRLTYSDDGDLIPSQLMKDFELVDEDGDYNDYEEGCREIAFFENASRSPSSVFQDFSYSEQVIDKVCAKLGAETNEPFNAVVVLFNYRANVAENRASDSSGVRLRFIGSMEYKM